MKLEKKYLLFSCSSNRNTVAVNIKYNGEIIEQVFANLCPSDENEAYYFVDVSDFKGLDVEIDIESVPRTEWARLPEGETEDEGHLKSLAQYVINSDSYELENKEKNAELEKNRPYVHFTPKRGWMNDPNGCYYKDGYYHLYFQHCPGCPISYWDNNHWGHAVSKDLLNWTELPPAIRYPHAASGAAFFSKEGKLHAATGPYLLTSEDDGKTFKITSVLELEDGSGVVQGDPKIFYHKETDRYVAITLKDLENYMISSSLDLKKWKIESEIHGFRECPEFTHLTADDGTEKDILFGGDGGYIMGTFDGSVFHKDEIDPDRHDKYRYVMNESKDFGQKYNGSYVNDSYSGSWERMVAYAYQIFTAAPGEDPVRIAWMTSKDNEHGSPFESRMTYPQRLFLKKTGVGLRVCCTPDNSIEGAYKETKSASGASPKIIFGNGRAFDIIISAEDDDNPVFKINGYTLVYDKDNGQMKIEYPGEEAFFVPYITLNNKVKIRAIIDIGSAEFFFGEGEVFVPLRPDNYGDCGARITLSGKGEMFANSLKKNQ